MQTETILKSFGYGFLVLAVIMWSLGQQQTTDADTSRYRRFALQVALVGFSILFT